MSENEDIPRLPEDQTLDEWLLEAGARLAVFPDRPMLSVRVGDSIIVDADGTIRGLQTKQQIHPPLPVQICFTQEEIEARIRVAEEERTRKEVRSP